MALDTLPFNEIFPACREVLDKELCPLKYTDLTEKALKLVGLSRIDVNWQRQIEDVREKMLLTGQYGTFYIGKPYYFACVKWWFETEQLRILNPSSGVIIPGNASAGADGAYEALMRDPYMTAKLLKPRDPRLIKSRASGMVLEKHVADFFRRNWPEFYQPPDNKGQWKTPCYHDFKLCINGKVFLIDVSGPRQNNHYGNPGNGKKPTHFHLLCKIIGRDVLWESVYPGQHYGASILPEGEAQGGMCPERMIVWLNCHKDNIDYQEIKDRIASVPIAH